MDKAVTLACQMARSRAFWAVTMNELKPTPTVHDYNSDDRYGLPVVEEHTKVECTDCPGKRVSKTKVSMIVRPLQIKWGDSSGHGYENYLVMRRREVVAMPI